MEMLDEPYDASLALDIAFRGAGDNGVTLTTSRDRSLKRSKRCSALIVVERWRFIAPTSRKAATPELEY